MASSTSSVNGIPLHNEEGFASMRKAGRLVAETLDYITPFVKIGVTGLEINRLAEEFMRDHGAIPATIGYKGYTHASCISPNHVVCHGIPNDKPFQDGDILNIDLTVNLDGWFGDSSRMYFVGDNIAVKARKLVEVTYDSMMLGIAQVKPGAHLGDIGAVIQNYAESFRFSMVEDFCGHGIGKVFHCPPSVLHFGRRGEGEELKPGMIFTIEPMVNAGKKDTKVLSDGWTAVTRDRSLSAQFEHTVGVTETGVEIFTLSPAGFTKPPYTAQ